MPAMTQPRVPTGSDDPFNFPRQELHRDGGLLYEGLERMRASGEVILGEGVRRFEQALASWLGGADSPPQVIGVANGTDALELALRASGLGPGDRVLLPSHTAYATLAAVLRLGAEPLFVDVEPGSALMSPSHLEALLENDAVRQRPPKALIVVHLYGAACDLDALAALCRRHELTLIEDCAQACGTLHRGRPVGTHGRFAAFSFYPTKNLAAFGDGGALVVNRPEDAEAARRSRFYGWDDTRAAVQFGVNSRLDELQAWVLLGKLAWLEKRIQQRRQVAEWYRQRLQGAVQLPRDGEHWQHSYHLYVVEVPAEQRDLLVATARRQGLPLSIHYPLACHQHPYVLASQAPAAPLPHTEALLKRIVSLPLNPYLEERHVEQVCTAMLPLLGSGRQEA